MTQLFYVLKRLYRLFFVRRVSHFIGDSHADVFWHMEFSPSFFWKINPKIRVVHGATATGLSNPNSKTRALPIFKSYIENHVKKNHNVFFQLGEVDCGFAIWFRSEKHNLSVNEQLSSALENYLGLIRCAIRKEANVFVFSAVLPTIKDGQVFGEVANLRRDVKANQQERTLLTLEFNKKLSLLLKKENATFIDFDISLLDPKTNVIKEAFLNKDPKNHHLDHDAYGSLINLALTEKIKT